MSAGAYTIEELMVSQMARRMASGELVVQGIATPLVFTAFVLAKRTVAPHLYFLYTVGNSLADVPGPVSISGIERLTLDGCLKRLTLTEINCELAPFFRPLEFMRPAQVDGRGNFNNTVIGPYHRPKVRLPGAAGIPDATNFNDHLNLYVPRHSPRILAERVDFRSGLGYGDPGLGRARWPIVPEGPGVLLTDLCTFDFPDGCARLASLHPGVDLSEVRAKTGFRFEVAEPLLRTEPPSAEELRVIREEVDPLGVRRVEFLSGRQRLEAIRAILGRERELSGVQPHVRPFTGLESKHA
jgi:glutaconate CoA-transferase subunit B